MRYLNLKTLRQEIESNANNVIDSDSKVVNWFRPRPEGYAGEWVDGVYTFVKIPDPVIIPLSSVQIRDIALAAIDTYDFKDGRIVQIRIKEDRDNLIGGIKKGQTLWKMEDNKVYAVTTEDLQAALDDQESQIAAIWAAHFADLERGETT